MTETFTVVLHGGPRDGTLLDVDLQIIRYGALTLPEYDGPRLADYLATTEGELKAHFNAPVTYSQVLYTWDGTVREDGARRFYRSGSRR